LHSRNTFVNPGAYVWQTSPLQPRVMFLRAGIIAVAGDQRTMIHIRLMTASDLPLGLRLSCQAGWNQVEADWQRFLDVQPDGCFVAEWDGTAVGTTVTTIFGPVAWVAMVLVEESNRGRGIGKALLNYALGFLDRRHVATVRLDATPQGRPLYERLGFVAQFQLARHEGALPPTGDGNGLKPASTDEWPALVALDQSVTHTDRSRILLHLFAEQPENVRAVRSDGRLAGFLTARPGRRAIQIGPCIAARDAGAVLFADACDRYAGRHVFLDIPVSNTAATRLAESQGLTVQRHLTRMCLGTPLVERVEWLWAGSGPEKG
jgi:GNAT superfamily N-acetyltransferase